MNIEQNEQVIAHCVSSDVSVSMRTSVIDAIKTCMNFGRNLMIFQKQKKKNLSKC